MLKLMIDSIVTLIFAAVAVFVIVNLITGCTNWESANCVKPMELLAVFYD